jgi:hypothetical protein
MRPFRRRNSRKVRALARVFAALDAEAAAARPQQRRAFRGSLSGAR